MVTVLPSLGDMKIMVDYFVFIKLFLNDYDGAYFKELQSVVTGRFSQLCIS